MQQRFLVGLPCLPRTPASRNPTENEKTLGLSFLSSFSVVLRIRSDPAVKNKTKQNKNPTKNKIPK